MLSRPKPGESEEDLLEFQNKFLAAGAPCAAQVVKKADKRKGSTECGDQDTRDVVKLEEFPDLPPTLAPAPPKKSKFKSGSVRFADADPETLLDQHDRHITAVFSKIIERDTSAVAVTAPLSSGDAFPRVFHRSEVKMEERPMLEKRSIFAQKIAAKRASEIGANSPLITKVNLAAEELHASVISGQSGQMHEVPCAVDGVPCANIAGPRIITGQGLPGEGSKEEAQKIHHENVERLRGMSEEQIRLQQESLLAQLDPSLISFLKSQSSKGARRMKADLPELPNDKVAVCSGDKLLTGLKMASFEQEQNKLTSTEKMDLHKEDLMDVSSKDGCTQSCGNVEKPIKEEIMEPSLIINEAAADDSIVSSMKKDNLKDKDETMEIAEDDLPVKPQKEWVHMDNVELEKLEWMKDLPQARQKRTKKGLQARFSLKGEIIPPDADLPTHLGLHHHGEEAERAGYSLQELFHLSRSQVTQQRALALQVLGRIVQKAKNGEFGSSLKGSVLRLLLDAGFLFLLRFSLDDTAENVIAGSLQALWALLVSLDDEEYLDMTFSWYQGMMVFPFLPIEDEEEDEDAEDEEEPAKNAVDEKERKKEKEEKKPDPDVARYDVIKGLLKTKILNRLRYILEVVRPSPSVVVNIFDILTRVARHSTEACTQVMDCPRLMETVIQNFLPAQWNCPADKDGTLLTCLYGIPCAGAMKLLRVLASSGRNLCARLLNKFELKERLSRFVAEDPQDLPLQRGEALKLSTEAFRLWAVAAGYGQACELYRDLYPVLVKIIQTLSCLVSDCRQGNSTAPMLVQRAAAVVTLLTNVTQTAACAAELQQQLDSIIEDGPQIPPPPVTWIHVAGLKPFLEACLKRSLEEISHPASWDLIRPLTSAYFIFLGGYYRSCSRQPFLNPIEYVEDAERLASEVLLPLLRQPPILIMWELLKPCSAVCNKLSCTPAPESVASIVSLSCIGGKPPMNVAGSKSPFPFLTSLLFLMNSLTSIHKGLVKQFAFVLEFKELINYLRQSWTSPSPSVTHCSSWILRHEYHLQYFVLSLAQKAAVACPDHSQHVSLYHSAAMMLLGRLLPGSEHLAYELLLSFIFNAEFFPEGKAGGPEAADLSDILHIHQGAKSAPPGSAASASPNPSRGGLLKEAYQQLPSIRACYLSHFSHLELALSRSQAAYRGQTHLIQSMLLPEVKGPSLPSDWPFLPLILLYNKVANAETRGTMLNSLPPDLVNTVTRNLQWVLLLETWRVGVLHDIPAAAKLARLACVFLTGGDLFLEGPVHCYTAALLSLYCQPKALDALELDIPLPGLFSFYDLYANILEQFEAVSFGDPLFGAFVLIPLQRRFSVQLRRSVFGEHVSTLRSLGIPLKECPIPLERYTSPPENCLDLLRLYFRTLMTGALRQSWCPILYAIAVAHMNSFIFSQDPVAKEVDAARKSMLRKTWLLTDEVLKRHLLYFKLPNIESPLGFDLFEQLPPLRQKYLESVTQKKVLQPNKEQTSP
ncbi:RNA polymerase II-associated protein 1 isoform X3 [Pleurodeles waltl]|uniref:RNA polymerase II-associated protein 1 isoform X3 n=1 Tax=Pleurodeles waltl TaxID=8319 RepID=UPI0037097EE7